MFLTDVCVVLKVTFVVILFTSLVVKNSLNLCFPVVKFIRGKVESWQHFGKYHRKNSYARTGGGWVKSKAYSRVLGGWVCQKCGDSGWSQKQFRKGKYTTNFELALTRESLLRMLYAIKHILSATVR